MNERADYVLHWVRSSYCADNACVEVACHGDDVLLRNSERPHDSIRITRPDWMAFLDAIKAGEVRVR